MVILQIYKFSVIIIVCFFFTNSLLCQESKSLKDANSEISDKDKGEIHKPKLNSFQIGIKGGIGIPMGKYKEEDMAASDGIFAELNVAHFWKKIGIGLSAGTFSNSVVKKNRQRIEDLNMPFETTTSEGRQNWSGIYIGAGPLFRFGNRLRPHIYINSGIMLYRSPEFYSDVILKSFPSIPWDAKAELLTYPSKDFNVGYYSAGLGLTYSLSRSWDISLNASYISGFNSMDYTYRYIDLIEVNGEPGIQSTDIIYSPVVKKTVEVNPKMLLVSIGFAMSF